MSKVNYAVIGLGWFGEKHCEGRIGKIISMYATKEHSGTVNLGR